MITQIARKKFQEYPVIAAVSKTEDFDKAFNSNVRILFMVGGDVFKTQDSIIEAKNRGYLVFFHMDLIEGIGKDASGLHFAKKTFGIAGIQSTRTHILKLAKNEHLITVHRLFVTDTQSIKSGMSLVQLSKPDIVEVTPGILPEVVARISREQSCPVISSGLITTPDDVKTLIESGASNIVCSNQTLWRL